MVLLVSEKAKTTNGNKEDIINIRRVDSLEREKIISFKEF